MLWTQAARRFTLRIALFAMLMTALAPTISHAIRESGRGVLVEVCTALGAKWVSAQATPSGQPLPATTPMLDDCPYCSLQGHSPALPPAPAPAPLASPLQFAVPLLFLLSPRGAHAWASAQPRAPPTLS